MIAHSFQLNERNIFYFKNFSLKPIFTPLERSFPPKWGKSERKWLGLSTAAKSQSHMILYQIITHIDSSGPNLGDLRRVPFFRPLNPPVTGGQTPPRGHKQGKRETFLLVDQFQHMIAHSFQLNERNIFYFKNFSLKPIFTPLERSFPPKWGKSERKWLGLSTAAKSQSHMILF